MSALDATFLHIEDANNPMHIGNVSVWEGPAPSYGDMVRAVVNKLPELPRYRQKVRFVPFGLGRPVWVDDPHFQVLYHIRHTALPKPGGQEQLRNLAGRIFGQPLDRGKPLWEAWLVEGLEGGRWAVIWKTHHCMVDGVSGTDLLTVMLSASGNEDEEAGGRPPAVWRPQPEPSTVSLLANGLTGTIFEPLGKLRGLPAAARAPFSSGNPVGPAARLASTLRLWAERSATSLNGPIGPHRRWGWTVAPVGDVKLIRTALGGTLNDVVLASITRGFRDLLLARGERVDGQVVRTLVPVSVRSEAEKGTYNNRVSALFPNLPVSEADPRERLRLIHEQMVGLKDSRQAAVGDSVVRSAGFGLPLMLSVATKAMIRAPQNLVQTITTNVPGPQTTLNLLGRPMLYAYPYVPIAGRIRVAIAIFSYTGNLYFGITGDYDSVPDIDILRWGIGEGMAELLALAKEGGERPQRGSEESPAPAQTPSANGRSPRSRSTASTRRRTATRRSATTTARRTSRSRSRPSS